MNPWKDVRDFQAAMGYPLDADPRQHAEIAAWRRRLITEESSELRRALLKLEITEVRPAEYRREALEAVALESCDLIYVALGTLAALGIDFEEAWAEVHRANIEKEPAPDKPRKPKGWRPPSARRAVR